MRKQVSSLEAGWCQASLEMSPLLAHYKYPLFRFGSCFFFCCSLDLPGAKPAEKQQPTLDLTSEDPVFCPQIFVRNRSS
jgi:hypothetical protein